MVLHDEVRAAHSPAHWVGRNRAVSLLEASVITVVLASHNGAATLPLTLASFTRLTVPEGGWKLIVVDNASSDNTPDIVHQYMDRLPLIYIYCATPGKNVALNQAIPEFEGELVVNTDDDVVADPNWLTAIAAEADAHPDYTIFAGQVRHYWQKSPPTWLECLAAEGKSFAGTDVSRAAGEISPYLIKGPNVAVRRHVYDSFDYPLGIGPDGTAAYAKGSETSFLLQLHRAGHAAKYVPAAIVRHIVRPHQVGILPVLRRYFQIGQGGVRLHPDRAWHSHPTIFGIRRYIYSLTLRECSLALAAFVRRDSYNCMVRLIDLQMTLGKSYEERKIRKNQQFSTSEFDFR